MKSKSVTALQMVGIIVVFAVLSGIALMAVDSVQSSTIERIHPSPNWYELDRYFANQASSPASSPTPAK